MINTEIAAYKNPIIIFIHLLSIGLSNMHTGNIKAGIIKSIENPMSIVGVVGPNGVSKSIILLILFGVIKLKKSA